MVDDRSHSEIDESFHVVNKRQEVRNSRQVDKRYNVIGCSLIVPFVE